MDQRIRGASSGEAIDLRLARLAARRYGILTRSEAERLGASRGLIERRVAASRWESLYPGVYRIAGTPESWRQHLLVACLVAGKGAVASHRSSATLRQIAGITQRVIEISVPPRRRVRRVGIIVHRSELAPTDVTMIDAIPSTTPTRTLIDLVAVLSADALEEALDDALRRRLTTVSRLRRRLGELEPRGRPGIGALRSLLERRDGTAVPESVLETRFLRLLRRSGLPEPARQYEIREQGRLLARVDFAYPALRLAIEVEGYRWHSGRPRWERDLTRRNAITSLGWQVLHVTSSDLDYHADRIIQLIAGFLKR